MAPKWRDLSRFWSCSRNGQVHLVPKLLQQLAFACGRCKRLADVQTTVLKSKPRTDVVFSQKRSARR